MCRATRLSAVFMGDLKTMLDWMEFMMSLKRDDVLSGREEQNRPLRLGNGFALLGEGRKPKGCVLKCRIADEAAGLKSRDDWRSPC